MKRPAVPGAAAPHALPALPTEPCLRPLGSTACVLDVSVAPNAKKTEVAGLHDGALRVRLAAPPVDGQANAALVKWLAQELGLPQRHIELIRGPSGRRKQLHLSANPQLVADWLRRVLAP